VIKTHWRTLAYKPSDNFKPTKIAETIMNFFNELGMDSDPESERKVQSVHTIDHIAE